MEGSVSRPRVVSSVWLGRTLYHLLFTLDTGTCGDFTQEYSRGSQGQQNHGTTRGDEGTSPHKIKVPNTQLMMFWINLKKDFLAQLLILFIVSSTCESVNHLNPNKHRSKSGRQDVGLVWPYCLSVEGREEPTVTDAPISRRRRSGWWMGPNQQQTEQLQETSPHHVYGNQPFSRDLLIAPEGWGGRKKQLDSPFFFTKKSSRLSTFH